MRREKMLTWGDVRFNFDKIRLMDGKLRKYRHTVKFGNQCILDSTAPPYPSAAFDRRVSNYLNNLDATETPSGIVSISTTNSCPYTCAFCSTNARRNAENDLDEELLKRVITRVEETGAPLIILHGGEPLYRFDRFIRLVKHARKETCLWMFTTGFGATPDRAAELKEHGMFGVWVSLDHYEPEVHNRLRGHPDAFDNACRAVEHFQNAGLYTCLSLVPPDDLYEPENFRKYYDFAKELGAAEIRVMERKPSGREACRGVTPHSPVLARLQKELFKDPAYRNHPPLSGLSTWLEKDEAFGCQCRFEYLFITSTGDVQPCEVTEVSFGNVQDEDFRDIYARACEAFQRPSTGCIPMVMFSEIRDYLSSREKMNTLEKADGAARIVSAFQERGQIPGVMRSVWPVYQRRLKAYRLRKKQGVDARETSTGATEPA